MGFFDAIVKAFSSLGGSIFPPSMSDIGDIGDLSTQMASRVDKAFKRVGLRMNEIDEHMKLLNKTMEAMSLDLTAMKYEEPICAHESVEEALRLR